MVPTKHGDLCRVRTGYEKVVASHSSSTYVGIAKDAGLVTKVDRVNNILKVEYKNGEADVFSFGEDYTNISGFYITQHLVCVVEVGDKVKKGDVLCYNDQFFVKDEYSNSLSFKHGVNARIVLMESDSTLEDSNAITTALSNKLAIAPTHTRDIALTKNSVIHQIAQVGDLVKNTDAVIVFEDSEIGDMGSLTNDDITTLEMLRKLNKNMPKAKHSGKIVKIEAYYSCPISEMHPSLAAIVNQCNKSKIAKHKFTQGTNMELKYNPPSVLPEGTKYKGIEFGKDTVVIQIYIQEDILHGVGDKLVVGNQLKSTTNKVIDTPIISESGRPIDMIFGLASVGNRVVLSPFKVGPASRVLAELEDQAINMYFSK